MVYFVYKKSNNQGIIASNLFVTIYAKNDIY